MLLNLVTSKTTLVLDQIDQPCKHHHIMQVMAILCDNVMFSWSGSGPQSSESLDWCSLDYWYQEYQPYHHQGPWSGDFPVYEFDVCPYHDPCLHQIDHIPLAKQTACMPEKKGYDFVWAFSIVNLMDKKHVQLINLDFKFLLCTIGSTPPFYHYTAGF